MEAGRDKGRHCSAHTLSQPLPQEVRGSADPFGLTAPSLLRASILITQAEPAMDLPGESLQARNMSFRCRAKPHLGSHEGLEPLGPALALGQSLQVLMGS